MGWLPLSSQSDTKTLPKNHNLGHQLRKKEKVLSKTCLKHVSKDVELIPAIIIFSYKVSKV
jgi:hypothetical protein